jgi:hypothetical protein
MKLVKDEEPRLDIRHYGRGGPTHRIHLAPAPVQTVARTAGRMLIQTCSSSCSYPSQSLQLLPEILLIHAL